MGIKLTDTPFCKWNSSYAVTLRNARSCRVSSDGTGELEIQAGRSEDLYLVVLYATPVTQRVVLDMGAW